MTPAAAPTPPNWNRARRAAERRPRNGDRRPPSRATIPSSVVPARPRRPQQIAAAAGHAGPRDRRLMPCQVKSRRGALGAVRGRRGPAGDRRQSPSVVLGRPGPTRLPGAGRGSSVIRLSALRRGSAALSGAQRRSEANGWRARWPVTEPTMCQSPPLVPGPGGSGWVV